MQAIQTFPVYRKFLLSLLRHLYHLTHFFLQLSLNKFLMYAKVLDAKISNINEAAKPIKFHFSFLERPPFNSNRTSKKRTLEKYALIRLHVLESFPVKSCKRILSIVFDKIVF